MKVPVPPAVINAMGVLVMHGLTQGHDSDGGWFISSELTLGPKQEAVSLGKWKVEVTRLALPKEPSP